MLNPETTSYTTEGLIAGEFTSANKTASAATYYRGQLLGRTDATGVYGPFNAAGAGGLEKIRAVCVKDITLSSQGLIPVYINDSEVKGAYLKATDGTTLTVTSTIIELAQDAGIIIR